MQYKIYFHLIFSVRVELKKQTKELDDVESYVNRLIVESW